MGKERKNMSELVKNKNGDWPKKKDLFSDGEINSDKILEVDFKDIEDDPSKLIDVLTRRNLYHNSKVSRSKK